MNAPILLVAFGAMSAAARETYAGFERDARAAFPGREIRWAYTAASLVARLQRNGEAAHTLAEAYRALRAEGATAVVVQSLHLVPGEKHREILAEPAPGLRVAIGAPLLDSEADLQGVAEDLLADLPADRPTLVVAHGHGREARFNAELEALKARLAAAPGSPFLTRLEGDGDPEGLARFIARAQALGRVHLLPFLLVAGDHLASDILGDQPDSFKSRLGVPGFSCAGPLGTRPWVHRRFLAKLGAALAQMEQP
jgi:sirohydrochlorin cobaltochelatase